MSASRVRMALRTQAVSTTFPRRGRVQTRRLRLLLPTFFRRVSDGVPAGHPENSPAIHGWESCGRARRSPVGTIERFSRPSGTWQLWPIRFPSVETLGYFQTSLTGRTADVGNSKRLRLVLSRTPVPSPNSCGDSVAGGDGGMSSPRDRPALKDRPEPACGGKALYTGLRRKRTIALNA